MSGKASNKAEACRIIYGSLLLNFEPTPPPHPPSGNSHRLLSTELTHPFGSGAGSEGLADFHCRGVLCRPNNQ